ncbi:glypican-6-like [Dendronephthya gigantea]|uniref:glypican-6-like n=1 Tax=Dendronephthya gigantea TaxID=151771 RepID=UPI00106A6A90|nr:glypican-6-like [Dendronephthya gigantea]
MNGFLLLVFLFISHARVDCVTKNGKKTCSQLTSARQNIPQTLILKNPSQGHNLKICRSNLTCCSKQMENELYMRSSGVLEGAINEEMNATHHFLTAQASLFDGYFRNLLKTSKVKWHTMLLLTYKAMYQRNRDIFDDFFSTLEEYYLNGDVDLDKSFNLFFQRIQSTMLKLLKSNLSNNPGFLSCTSDRIKEIKPFGNYQMQITNQLKSTLVYARTFVVGLQAGSNMTQSVINYLSRDECREVFTKMQYCSVCEGIPNALVCNATCHNLLQSCFVLDALLESQWNGFIRGVYLLSEGLDGRYDIEAVFGQLSYDISSAIMEFQRKFSTIFVKAKALCPSGNRKKREIDNSGGDLYLEGERVRRSSDLVSPSSTSEQLPLPLDTFTRDFREKIAGIITNSWIRRIESLPEKICGGQILVSRNQNQSCWNGVEMGKNSGREPSINVNIGGGNSRRLFVEQMLNFRRIAESVSDPDKDGNVDEDGNGEPDYSASGNGSASGSGSGSGSGELFTTRYPFHALTRLTYPPDPSDSSTKPPHVVNPATDGGDEGSGTSSYNEYTTTPISVTDIAITDDEDLNIQSGSGDNDTDPTREPNILFNPTRKKDDEPIIHVKNIIGTRPPDNGTDVNVMSHVLLLFLIFVGLNNI